MGGLAATPRAGPLDRGAFSLIEIVFVLALVATISAISIPPALSTLDDLRTAGAVRYVSSRLQEARMHAIATSRETGMRFTRDGDRYAFALFVDGNGNGIRTTDVQGGTDPALRLPEHLSDAFAGVEFGALPGIPAVDASGAAPGSDPIRLGASDIVSFTALGTATPGSLYILGRREAQYVIRVFGETGKTRILRFDTQTHLWKPL